MPRLQGAQRFDAFFNAGAKQREAVEQLNRMTRGDAQVKQAFYSAAMTDLVQSASNAADTLSLPFLPMRSPVVVRMSTRLKPLA